MQSRYVGLLQLANDWAQQGGELPWVVLDRLCDWASRDQFPPGTFITSHGKPVDPARLKEAVAASRGAAYEIVERDAQDFLSMVRVAKDGALVFCQSTGTRPAPCLAKAGIRELFTHWRRDLSPAPPEYVPTPEETEAERVAIEAELAGDEARQQAEDEYEAEVEAEQKEFWRRIRDQVAAEEPAVAGTVGAESRARNWFRKEVDEKLLKGERLTKAQAFEGCCRAAREGLTRRGFEERVWKPHAPKKWKRPGAPKKHYNETDKPDESK